MVAKEVNNKVTAQKVAGWDFKIAQIQLDNNKFQFDNDNNPKLARGMDFSHLAGDSITLYANNFEMAPDSLALAITKGSMKEKVDSGWIHYREILYMLKNKHRSKIC